MVGNLEVEQWVRENTEKVKALRDEASANYRQVSADRKVCHWSQFWLTFVHKHSTVVTIINILF